MYPRMVYRQIPAFRRVFTSPQKRFVHNYKVYFPREPNSNSFDLDRKPLNNIYSHVPTYGHGHTSLPPPIIPYENPWRYEPRWIRWTTYTASLMTLGLFWIFYKYREPIYCNERMQLNFLSDDDVDDYLYTQFEKRLFRLGIVDYFTRPFTVSEKHPDYVFIKKVFDKLITVGELEVMELELKLMRNKVFSESEMKIHPQTIVVNHAELTAAKTKGGVATILAPRIARKALNHQSELLNHFVFACFATVPAVLFSAVALRSKAARAFAVPYFWYYGALTTFQNTMLLSRQLNEADYVGLVIMERAGYDITEATEYRRRQVKLGEATLETFEKLSEKTPFNPLRISDIVKEKLGLTPLHEWTATQRIHAANVEKFVPMVRAKVAGEVVGRIDEGEPKTEGEDGSESSDENTKSGGDEEVKQTK